MVRFFSMLFIFLLSRPALAQWTAMNGPDGGIITAIADAGGYLMCGSQDGYMFTSSDNGATWAPKGKVPPEVEFSSKGLSGGVYFYKLRASSFVETKKMILIR